MDSGHLKSVHLVKSRQFKFLFFLNKSFYLGVRKVKIATEKRINCTSASMLVNI